MQLAADRCNGATAQVHLDDQAQSSYAVRIRQRNPDVDEAVDVKCAGALCFVCFLNSEEMKCCKCWNL